MKRIFLLIPLLFLVLQLSARKKPIWAFCYFKGNGVDGLHLAYSEDGLNWKALKKDSSFLRPQVSKDKLMRDPNIVKGKDGLYHMVWTVSWTDKGIGYANSKDLIHWSEQRFLPVMAYAPTVRNTWAPEITYDDKNDQYMIYWASTIPDKFTETASTMEAGYNHRIYYTTTKDFRSFSDTKVLYDPGFNSIDATILKDGKRWVMFIKDETREPAQKNIKIAFADNLTGPYTKASAPITKNYWAEGPTVLKEGDEWIVYFDKYRDHKYGAVSSKDLENWEDISNKISLPGGIRHGSIFQISKKDLAKLKRLSSSNLLFYSFLNKHNSSGWLPEK
ncbi:glycoside hydrolase family 43 protein [Desertivirga arenae]|uniref:glycoside hydrolase family 43 protein n=1 Tax=Desertivirga arenae TaxID=2810309 RepID=UPI001A97B1F6|nr:glycoside hydrolase family 43 protein [Pedobacter sp. SYSU D00823]